MLIESYRLIDSIFFCISLGAMQASKPGTQQATYLDKHLAQSWDTSRWRRTSWSSCWHLEIRCAFASCDKIQLRRWGERRHCSKRSWLRHQGGVKLAVSWQFTRLKCDFGGHVMVRTLNTWRGRDCRDSSMLSLSIWDCTWLQHLQQQFHSFEGHCHGEPMLATLQQELPESFQFRRVRT